MTCLSKDNDAFIIFKGQSTAVLFNGKLCNGSKYMNELDRKLLGIFLCTSVNKSLRNFLLSLIQLLSFQANSNCLLLVTPKGGHLGWVAGAEAPIGAPWTDPVVMDFLEHLEQASSIVPTGDQQGARSKTQVPQHVEVQLTRNQNIYRWLK